MIEKIELGHRIFKTKVSDKLVEKINNKIDTQIEHEKTISAVSTLSGKIKSEYKSNWIHGMDEENGKELINTVCYALDNSYKDNAFNIAMIKKNEAWINDQRKNEYQIIHTHSGESTIGFTSILFLKVPDFGPEYTNTVGPTNGKTEIIGNIAGQFIENTYTVEPAVGDFYVFPYDLRHIVYPFTSDGLRRSMSINYDVFFEKRHL